MINDNAVKQQNNILHKEKSDKTHFLIKLPMVAIFLISKFEKNLQILYHMHKKN